MQDDDLTPHPEAPAAKAPERPMRGVSRRGLLAGTAGLTLGAVLAAPGSRAQDAARHAGHGTTVGFGDRLYTVNPSHPDMTDIAENPANVPPPIARREPATVRVELETVEIEAPLGPDSTYRFWTFNGTVPGPMLRVRVGDTVEVHLKNNEESWYQHNVDFHAATGPGGGAAVSTANPGEERTFSFKALNPGIFVYHCAVPPVALHISSGMYGLILVEPEEGLPPVDREFYVMQGELYTEEPLGSPGLLTESYDKLLNERPEYFVFNGHVGALTEHYPLTANVGETVRIYFGVGGPNYTSTFHVIGEVFDRVYNAGDVLSPPLQSTQSVTVGPGSACIVDFKCEVPGRYVLVDHALSRAERGLAGYLLVEGEEQPELFTSLDGLGADMSGH